MDILIGFAVAALKAGVSGVVGNEIVQALADQGIDIGSDKLSQYLEKAQKELSQVLSDKSLMKMNVPEDYIDYIKEEIKGLLRSISLDEDLFRNCHYDAKSLAEALYKKYKRQKKDFVECESEIQKVLYVMSEKAISLEKEREGFTKDSLVYLMKNEDKKMKILHTLDEFMKTRITDSENGREPQRKKRLPDRTEEYRRKWNENMFLNDFDEDDENAGVNIPLYKLYKPLFYRLKEQKKNLSNLEERLDRCIQGQDLKNRMLLILGQPGMGKSTMITWFIAQYQKKVNTKKKEILVYRFTDLNVDWSFNPIEGKKNEECIDSAILKCINMEKQDLNGKILILDGFDEVAIGNNRMEILNCLYNAWARETRIENFALLVTCRENYIEDLSRLLFPYITLQPWSEDQIDSFCRNYETLTKSRISEVAIDKMKEMKNIFGIPIILYMALALEITVRDESSVVEVYDQIFSLIYDRCLKSDASIRSDTEHRIAEIKEQIHQFSREISMWMFENNPEQAAIPKNEYEKIRDEIFKKDGNVGEAQKKDVLIGNYFRMVYYYNGIDTAELTFVHRSIYEYLVAETICSEIRESVTDMTEKSQEKLARVLGYRLKKGKIDYTIGQYLKTKVSTLIATYSEEKKNQFYRWLEGTVEKMMDTGMLYYTGENINKYRNIIEKELICFLNLLAILRLFLDFSDRKYILQNADREKVVFYILFLRAFYFGRGIKFNKIGLYFIGLNRIGLSRIDLSRIDLEAVDLDEAYLVGVYFDKSNLSRAHLRESNLNKAHLREVNLNMANLKGAKLNRSYLNKANLNAAILREAELNRADLREAELNGTDLQRTDLRSANLYEAKLREAKLNCANLQGADLREADLRRSNLRGAKLIKAKLNEAKLNEAKLNRADLREADLRGAILRIANFRDANIERSKWLKKDVCNYISIIKQSQFDTIYIYSEETGEKRECNRIELLTNYPDRHVVSSLD